MTPEMVTGVVPDHPQPIGKESKQYGSGNGTERVYFVEARTSFGRPEKHAGMVLTSDWQRIETAEVPPPVAFGVPNDAFNPLAATCGMFGYRSATALAAWFRAAEGWRGSFCVETRLVAVDLTYSYSTVEVGVSKPVSGSLRPSEEFAERES